MEAVSPELGNRVQRVRVQMPGTSPELLQKFREKKIDFAAHSNAEDGGAVFLNLLGEPLGSSCKRNWVASMCRARERMLKIDTSPHALPILLHHGSY